MVFVWKNAIAKLGGVFDIYELLPAFICGLLVNVIVSLLTPKPEKEITEVFDELKNSKEFHIWQNKKPPLGAPFVRKVCPKGWLL